MKSIDEKFAVNAANGTASYSIPVPLSPGRNGFTPALALTYSSGGGNSAFGHGWALEIPAIQRKTEKKLPEYRDTDESDTFIFSGAEDLVPELIETSPGQWTKHVVRTASRTTTYYRPRIEGGFARIERIDEADNTFWRVTNKENVISVFGQSPDARVSSPVPGETNHIFRWNLDYSYDDKGNIVCYGYEQENSDGVLTTLSEKNRLDGLAPFTNTYLKTVRYGNVIPFYAGDALPTDFLFETVLDYGEHDTDKPTTQKVRPWPARTDAFSDYRAGFEIRTCRLCRRVLVFHHLKAELGFTDYLVRSLTLLYDERPHLTYLESVVQTGYIWNADGSLREKRALPPLSFEYVKPGFSTDVKTIAPENLADAPVGLADRSYQWIDLFSEGISGILTEQATGWFYKENLGDGAFAPARLVNPKPSFSGLADGSLAIQELTTDGQKYLVSTDPMVRGYVALDPDAGWQPFQPFTQFPNLDLRDPNLKFLDLNGDGMADILISYEQEFVWYAAKGKIGYDDYQTAAKAADDERGPRVLFADKDERMLIALADMSGDGLTDIVIVRYAEVSYYPNLGYGRFGARVTMDNVQPFDRADSFNPQFLHFADIDGSGTADLIYVGHDQIQVWFNQSGNSLSAPSGLFNPFPKIDNQSQITLADLLGNGTSCLVWSSALPQHRYAPLRYIDLMNGQKPHVMRSHRNNLGKTVDLTYTTSTRFYLDDKKAGRPWLTKLPFPVQCVSRVTVTDAVSQTRFATEYSYHHGYYDAVEQEFRGFAMVEQRDTETYDRFVRETAASGALNTTEKDLFQPPIITRSWFHTGAYLNRQRVLNQLRDTYYPNALIHTGQLTDALLITALSTDTLPECALPNGLTTDELVECYRALKGSPLRQEVYSEEGDAAMAIHPYSVAQNNYEIRRLQPKQKNQYAVFQVIPAETLTIQYERNPADPRVAHTLTLETDPFGNVLQLASVVYGRRKADPTLPTEADRARQANRHIVYTQNRFTDPVNTPGAYRLPLPCEAQTWELNAPAPAARLYMIAELKAFFANATIQLYEQETGLGQKRNVEHARILFLKNDLTGPMPFGQMDTLALPYENYLLAFTPSLVNALYGSKVDESLLRNEGRYVRSEGDANYWITSGKIHYHPDLTTTPFAKTIDPPTMADVTFARQHFYQPRVFEDNVGHLSKVFYDSYNLLVIRAIDALDNETNAEAINYRTLMPGRMRDANDNRTGVRFDALGLVSHTFVLGKAGENQGDWMDINSLEHTLEDQPTSTLTYEFRYFDSNGILPNRTRTDVREKHYFREKQPQAGGVLGWLTGLLGGNSSQRPPETETDVRWQTSYSYSDGSGHEVLKKVQAEPGLAPQRDAQGHLMHDAFGRLQTVDTGAEVRWVGNGRTIVNNKGKAVKQYEPYFDTSPDYNDERELVELGVTSVLFYDAPGRLIRTEHPNGTTSKVIFDAWQQRSYDENDTVQDSRWYADRIGGQLGEAEREAAQKSAVHHDTPTTTHLDSLGRSFLVVTHNRSQRTGESVDEAFLMTRTEQDIEGNNRSLIDARDNVVMAWQYDRLGNVCYQRSMDAGDRWLLADAMGKPIRLWDSRRQTICYDYDDLHRPLTMRVKDSSSERVFERYEYGELIVNAKARNLRGQLFRHFDTAGVLEIDAFDFKGNPLRITRQLLSDYKTSPDWAANPALNSETFATETHYDALNRPVRLLSPDGSVLFSQYNEANLLNRVGANVKGASTLTTFVENIDYDAKGQRERIHYGNGTTTRYDYDRDTYRLTRLLTTADTGSRVLQDLGYTYDPVGNITRQFDNAQQTIFYGGQQVETQNNYGYDALYRLIEAGGREHIGQTTTMPQDNFRDAWSKLSLQPNSPVQLRQYTQKYSYDAVGNILKMQHLAGPQASWTRTYHYNPANNQLTRSAVGTQGYAYTYNEHGSLATMPHLTAVDWNFREEMTHADLGGGGAVWYVYDAAGQRSRKVVERPGNRIEERIYLGGFEIYRERTGTTLTLERETLHLMDGQQRVAMVETRTAGSDGSAKQLTRYQYSNHLGSAGLELDELAQIISYEEYHPYGTTAYQATDASRQVPAKRYRYTGMERDEESGFSYHSARYYAPWLGRWTSCDPIGVGDGVNVYAYVRGNPVRLLDFTGFTLWDTVKKKASAAASSVEASVKPGGSVFEAVDSAFNKNEHPVSAAVLNNMAKRGDELVTGVTQDLKQTAGDYADIAYYSTHATDYGAKEKLQSALQRRADAPLKQLEGAVVGFGQQVKRVGNAGGDIAYYSTAGSNDPNAGPKIASAVTDIVLDGPQIVLTVEGAASAAKSLSGAFPKGGGGGQPPVPPKPPGGGTPHTPPKPPAPKPIRKPTIEMRLEGNPTLPAKPGDIIKASRGKNGKVGGVQPHDSIRVMPGDPNASLPMHQQPYVHIREGGKIVGKGGTEVPKSSPEAHIPVSEWSKWQSWHKPK